MSELYTLKTPKSLVLKILFKKRDLDPVQGLADALQACDVEKHTRLKEPCPAEKNEMAEKYDPQVKTTRKQNYLAGMNAMIRWMRDNIDGRSKVEERAKTLVEHPIDLTLREVAFIAKTCDREAIRLINEIVGGLKPEQVNNWKAAFKLEKTKHAQTKEKIREKNAEIDSLKRTVARLRTELHENGIKDPTLQIRD